MNELVPSSTRPDLTDREWEIACRLAAGLGRKRIAAELGISINTVDVHLRHVAEKVPGNGRPGIRITHFVLTAPSTSV